MTNRHRSRTSTRRRSLCSRHIDEPVTGICASCLRERLSGLDAGEAVCPSSPELQRSRSVACSDSKLRSHSPRRKSCDVVSARDCCDNASSLGNHFDLDDLKSGLDGGVMVESKNLGLSMVSYTVIQSNEDGASDGSAGQIDDIRASGGESGEADEEGESKTMKEFIDLEFENKSKKPKDLRGIAGNLWTAASVFSKKLRKWKAARNEGKKVGEIRSKRETKFITCGSDGNAKLVKDVQRSDISGRRSCDVEPPRFSIDGGCIPFEEPRASWDGYMIARTIPRLAPMFSVVENGVLGSFHGPENRRLSVDGPVMLSVIEDETSSGASGSGHSNSDSLCSLTASSFDRSSSVRSFGKKGTCLDDRGISPANAKLVITEKELKDWRVSSTVDDGLENVRSLSKNSISVEGNTITNIDTSAKKSVRWRRVCTRFGRKPKNSEKMPEPISSNPQNPPCFDSTTENQQREDVGHKKDLAGLKLTRSNSIVASRNSCGVVRSNYGRRSVDSAVGFGFRGTKDFQTELNGNDDRSKPDPDDDEMTPFYMTPLQSLRSNKSVKLKLQNTARLV